jgi:hypothetical protein
MNLTPIRANMTELQLNDGTVILFSYKTPVAARINGDAFQTAKRWSNTTSRHINEWGAKEYKKIPQDFFDALIAAVKP